MRSRKKAKKESKRAYKMQKQMNRINGKNYRVDSRQTAKTSAYASGINPSQPWAQTASNIGRTVADVVMNQSNNNLKDKLSSVTSRGYQGSEGVATSASSGGFKIGPTEAVLSALGLGIITKMLKLW